MLSANVLCESAGVRVARYSCRATRHAPAEPEVQARAAVSLVERGAFTYHREGRAHTLGPGSVMLVDAGAEYLCTHEHDGGDECLSFQYDPEILEGAGGPFGAASLPALPRLDALAALAQAVIAGRSSVGLDEVAWAVAGRVHKELRGSTPRRAREQPVNRSRAIEAASFITERANQSLSLEQVAGHLGLSPFYFLRLFRGELGVTPHQYLIRARLSRAAALLLDGTSPVTEIAYAVGFLDLSNFVRTFHREVGCSPAAFRRGAGQRKILQDRSAAGR